jgi:hypothetical protein
MKPVSMAALATASVGRALSGSAAALPPPARGAAAGAEDPVCAGTTAGRGGAGLGSCAHAAMPASKAHDVRVIDARMR